MRLRARTDGADKVVASHILSGGHSRGSIICDLGTTIPCVRRRVGPRCPAVRTIPRTNECVAVRDRPAPFGRHCREMRLAVTFPFIPDNPIKAMIAVMDVCLQLHASL